MSWVNKICNDYGLTQYQLSKLTGINQSSFTTIKRNRTPLSMIKSGNLRKLSDTLGLTMEQLLKKYQ